MRVLIVEDVPRYANRIAEGLRDQGIAVDVAYDGREAAVKLKLNPYDVVLLDRDLPGIHGDQLCQLITHTEDPAMILMLTAAATPEDRGTGLALGADDYLPKPFHFPELVLRIRALARRKPTAQPRTLKAAGIELDPLTGTVSRDGRPIDLTAKERAVLRADTPGTGGQPAVGDRGALRPRAAALRAPRDHRRRSGTGSSSGVTACRMSNTGRGIPSSRCTGVVIIPSGQE